MEIELVEHYLDKFDGRPHSIFHPATLRAQVRDGALKQTVLYAICAIGCKFSANPETRAQGFYLLAESKRLLQADLSNICLENIQACILIALLSVGHGESGSEALFFRIATAMAEILGLNNSDSETEVSLIDREIRRRIWWSLYMTDLWCMCGQGLYSQLKHVESTIDPPMNDSIFMALRPEQSSTTNTNTNTTPQGHGIWSCLVTLVPLFEPIHKINCVVANGEPHNPELDQRVEQLAWTLEDWKNRLPADAQMSEETLRQQQKAGLGGLLISLHLAYHHYSILLYFRFLDGQRPIASIHQTYITRCKFHASSFSSLLLLSRQLKGCDVVYPNVGHMATVSSSVLVHTLLFGGVDELEKVSQELNTNFEALIELKQFWPSISAMIERLIMFQDMCLLSTEPAPHKLDGWMLRFLTEHSLNFDTKSMGASSLGLNAEVAKMSSRAKELAQQGRYLNLRSA
ncbi:hypothetical protein LTR84_011128 [Exophiala bonariae]|uniref:Xylanolytic transcriptional activator regulatory domain-containing protein n=1 Tax=Exophiala bonariae TaxID=1690606 RepID=A0AAV9NM12_9EURO|nr:hypothetical protein LTR84_011128 [Exophiala bonariae]